jgi:GR25 family glycosyltransferase involved in LPS biosynthesis
MLLNEYFDKIYVLNLKHRVDRKSETLKKLKTHKIDVDVFQAYDGRMIKPLWDIHKIHHNNFFSNSNYLACAVSHISIYQSAIDSGYKRILILEDDNAYNTDLVSYWNYLQEYLPTSWNELLYFGWIPLSDDLTRWDYNIVNDKFINKHLLTAHNMWGLYAYGIHENLMKEMIDIYINQSYPMEIDRFFVNHIQPRGNSYAITPQLCAATDGFSDNSGHTESGMLDRSIDTRYIDKSKYI